MSISRSNSRLTREYPSIQELSLFAQYRAKEETPLERLLHAAAFALPVSYEKKSTTQLAAIAQLQQNPELLFEKGYVKDAAGHLIYGSTYQVFLGSGDIWALRLIHEHVLPKIKGGDTIALQQHKEQFPRHAENEQPLFDERNFAVIAEVRKALAKVVMAISSDPCTKKSATQQRTREAVNELLQLVMPKEGEIIKSGLHNPPEILRMAHKVYDKQWQKWPPDKLCVFSQLVIGGLERYVSAVDAQSYKKGIWRFNNAKNKPNRSKSYISKDGVISRKIGQNTHIDIYYGDTVSTPTHVAGHGFTTKHLGILMATKEMELTKLYQHPEPREKKSRGNKR